jgi:hypothetical protein
MILFKFVQKCQEDICFRCGSQIQSIEDLSIEHKLPWEGIDIDLFWDLDNIVFSHLKCNLPHRQNGGTPRKSLNGKLFCYSCEEYKIPSAFSKNKYQKSGRKSSCKKCISRKDARINHSKQHNYGLDSTAHSSNG